MAFFLQPRFVPAYQASQCSPFGLCAPESRPSYTYRVARPQPRPQYSSFNHFFSQVDELLGEIDREAQRQALIEAHLEAQREAHRKRQQRKRALRANFGVSQTKQGWQVDGDILGFEQENINIEITDEHTVKIAGNTRWQSEKAQPQTEVAPATEQPATEAQPDTMDGVTLNEAEAETVTEAETATVGADTEDSDTESHKSHQAFVEDDYEDLGAETSSLRSASSAASAPAEPKGKEKAVEEPAVEAPATQPQPEQPQQEERVHGAFERTFRFPERIDTTNVSASFKDNVLQIYVPRAQVVQTRKITIQ